MTKLSNHAYHPYQSVRTLPGVGSQRAQALTRLGIHTVGDLLYHFPRGYQHRGDLRLLRDAADGEVASFLLTVSTMPVTARLRGRMLLTKFSAVDESGARCVISYFNQPYMQERFAIGKVFRFYGKIGSRGGSRTLTSPISEAYSEEKPLPVFFPVYPLTSGITQRLLQEWIAVLLDALPESAPCDPFPSALSEELRFPSLPEALRLIHRPQTFDDIRRGRERFVFEQLLTFALGVQIAKRTRMGEKSPRMHFSCDERKAFLAALPYCLTGAQQRTIEEIARDLCGVSGQENALLDTDKEDLLSVGETEKMRENGPSRETGKSRFSNTSDLCMPMNRMLSGDVGSGKTVCAAAAAYIAACNREQCALMVPTEILAQQHYHDLKGLFAQFGIQCCLLTGSTPAAEKRMIRAGLADGSILFVIGTHALLSPDIVFARLGLIITDEQHRFGVQQRAALTLRAEEAGHCVPHMLVMSATPIPRSLMLVLYGDLSLSVLDELPPGKQKIDTCVVDEGYRDRVNRFLAEQLAKGHQAYVVCPAIDAGTAEEEPLVALDAAAPVTTESGTVHSVVSWGARLAETFPHARIGILHGNMKSAEKEKVMLAFARNEIQILVSTTVIEVGINVPNATLMVIENADRFGLAQLHQLRGRVGRGTAKSYCILVSEAKGENARARLQAMRDTDNGYVIAERDLALRGPGDFFPDATGEAQQHGKFSLAGLCDNMEEVHRAFRVSAEILKNDPDLREPKHAGLRAAVDRLYRVQSGAMN